MDDIIATVPECCGDKSCPVQWHLAHYWAYADGSHSVCDADGNHDEIDADDIPTPETVREAWREYSRHVATTGADPLSEFMPRRTVKRRESWRFKVRPSILGAVAIEARRGRRVYDPRALPSHVAEFMTIEPGSRTAVLSAFPNWAAFQSAYPDYTPGTWLRVAIDHEAQRKPETISKELRAAARRHIRAE